MNRTRTMSHAYKCDICGKLVEGEARMSIDYWPARFDEICATCSYEIEQLLNDMKVRNGQRKIEMP